MYSTVDMKCISRKGSHNFRFAYITITEFFCKSYNPFLDENYFKHSPKRSYFSFLLQVFSEIFEKLKTIKP